MMRAREPARFLLLALALLAAALSACSATRALNATVPAGTHRFSEGIRYGPGPRQQLDLYQPLGAPPAGGWPVALFIYGGSWNRGDRADYRFVGEALAARGVVTAIADYRLYPEVHYPQFLEDSALALAWLLREAPVLGGNARRVFLFGHSAGAYNAAMLALDARWLGAQGHAPRELAGWVGLAGPYDFLPIANPEVRPVFFHPDYPALSQPIEHASGASPPAFLGAARPDPFVDPERNTLQLARKLEAAGVPLQLKVYEKVNHASLIGAFARPLRWLAPVFEDVLAFIKSSPPRADDQRPVASPSKRASSWSSSP